MFREAIAVFEEMLSADHMQTAIARIKLDRALLRLQRYVEAEPETLAGYEVMRAQASASSSFLRAARTDLAVIYEAIGQPENAARFRAEFADAAN